MNTLRKQFRVWDKYRQLMLYDDFIIRHNNPSNTECFEYTQYEAEPLEEIDEDTQCDIRAIMHDSTAYYSLIDWSNFYGQENFITMQATGMHDKEGNLIWEYDLLSDGDIVHPVEWYYCNFVWNGQQITDFRDFDKYGKEIINEPKSVTIIERGEEYTGVISLGYQGETFGLETKNLIKVGNLFEHGKQYGFKI